MPAVKVDSDLSMLCDGWIDLIPEAGVAHYHIDNLQCQEVELRYLKDVCFDGERSWTLATLWYQRIPVAVIQRAGRGGVDYCARFITNNQHFLRMCVYIRECDAAQFPPKENTADVIRDDDDTLRELTEFYGNELADMVRMY